MKTIATMCLVFVLASASTALAADRSLTAEWGRMPKDARVAYMAGAVTGLKVFCETQGGGPKQVQFVINQAVAAMDQLAADEFNRSLPMMAVAAAALAVAMGEDPRPKLATGHMLANPDDPMNRLYAAPVTPGNSPPANPPAAVRHKR